MMNCAPSTIVDRGETPSDGVRRFEVKGGLLLLDESCNTLFAYSDVALFIWNLIEAARSEAEIIAAVAEQWGIPISHAQDDVRAIVDTWRAQGLLIGQGERPAHSSPTLGSEARPALASAPSEWTCTIRGTAFAFTIATELATPLRALFSHLETPAGAPQTRMAIVRTPSGELALVEDNLERLRTDEPALALGALFVAVLERIRPGLRWFALLHGAALAHRGHAFALAGSSGSGKSTLAAALLGAGFDYLADDLVALSSPHATIIPWPLPLSLKPGSLEVLTPRIPALARATRYRTKDVEARLLVPHDDAWDAEPVKLRTLIFPSFAVGGAPVLRRLSVFEALARLLTDRVWLGDPITEERVTSFLAWLDETPAYAISYGTLDDAVHLVESLIP
jgi:hypothetical protein